MVDELHAFLTELSNLDTALEVAEAVKTIRREVFEQFWGQVKEQLSVKLQHPDYQRQWEVRSSFAAPYPHCGIYWKHCDVQFAVGCYTGTDTNNYSACYGISRGKEIRTQDRDKRDQALSARLGTEELVIDEDNWWVGLRFLHDLDLPEFRMTKKEDVLTLHEDNRDPKHPLAHKLVSLLWDLFTKHREALEDLNTNYPY